MNKVRQKLQHYGLALWMQQTVHYMLLLKEEESETSRIQEGTYNGLDFEQTWQRILTIASSIRNHQTAFRSPSDRFFWEMIVA